MSEEIFTNMYSIYFLIEYVQFQHQDLPRSYNSVTLTDLELTVLTFLQETKDNLLQAVFSPRNNFM
jgi:hypothetical protein